MGLREQTRSAVRGAIAEHALVLFDEKGFDATTVEDIAVAAGISSRSFFRYFATKEDAVIPDPAAPGLLVRDALADRPADEAPWPAMRAALQPIVELADEDPLRTLRAMRVIVSTASLRARNLEKHIVWADMITPLMVARLGDPPRGDVLAQAVVAAAFTCLDVAFAGWVAENGSGGFGEVLDLAFAGVHS
ncbi:TetR family transcriptional regulator [Streptomyces sp. NPDC001822]|uniref:TetR family transcriptional regulator n=1 Tax=Streptomyces sp. NPDC001822 TaxID=3364614 RepID=UPI0036C05848